MVVCGRKKEVHRSICWYVHWLKTVPLFFCLSLFLLTPPLYSALSNTLSLFTHPSLSQPRTPPPLISFAFFLFVFHAESVARSPAGPKQSIRPPDRLRRPPASPSSAAHLSQPHGPCVGCSSGVFPPSTYCRGPCVSVCGEYSESPGHLPPMQVRMNKCLYLLYGATQPPQK